jgi:DNA-binding LytR/AlgR family response regulator
MNILICDDVAQEALKLEDAILAPYGGTASGFEGNIIRFDNGKDALACILSDAKIDLCFLDILMPEMDGITLARRLREVQYKGEIVFLTATKEYAVESYEVRAYDYLLKPPNARTIAQILRRFTDTQKNADTTGIPVATRTLARFLFFHEISFIEVIGKKVYFHLLDGSEIEINATFSEFLPKVLADRRFAQCHRSYVVNMDAVSYIQGREIFFRCGKKAPISRSNAEFDKQYIKSVFEKER